MKKKPDHATNDRLPSWNLTQLYKSQNDPRIDRDMKSIEKQYANFARRFDNPKSRYLTDSGELLGALKEFEKIYAKRTPKPLLYFFYLRSLNNSDNAVHARMSLLLDRHSKTVNQIKFFEIALGSIPPKRRKQFLNDKKLSHYRYLLSCIFADARHKLSTSEEKIISLKNLPANDMWVSHTEKILYANTIDWDGRKISLGEAFSLIPELGSPGKRGQLHDLTIKVLASVAPFAEGEINAIFTNKKIDDELRGYEKPYSSTVEDYRNDPAVVEHLRETVTSAFRISHRFYKLKARLLGQKKLRYYDRAAKIGSVKVSYPFNKSLALLKDIFGSIDAKYSEILDSFIKKGQIDAAPKQGKDGGAYCSPAYEFPTFVLLNHTGSSRSFTTFAHEMGHAYHHELARSEGSIYSETSMSLAETASTLFESLAFNEILRRASPEEQILMLHDRVNEDIATIFRQIACFNFELELHNAVRSKGFISKEEIAEIHNRNMKAYLGPLFDILPEDGNMFVQWSHIRRFFYVYSYAYGLLVSKALLRRYRNDKSFWTKIEQFLSAGGRDTPENILKEIGINVKSPEFWKDGLREIEDDVKRLEKLVKDKSIKK